MVHTFAVLALVNFHRYIPPLLKSLRVKDLMKFEIRGKDLRFLVLCLGVVLVIKIRIIFCVILRLLYGISFFDN